MNAPRSARLLTSVAVSAALVASGCASPGGYTGYGSESETTCVDDLYAPWEQRCPWAKVKTFLVAMTGGLLMGMASGVSRYGVTDTGRYKGYKTYDSTFRSPYGTTHCRTQLGGSNSYTSCD
jgi:hypothetical protein